jgi:hypothetical protein
MRFRTTVILFLLALVGVTAAVIVERRQPSRETAERFEATPLLTARELPEKKVERITLERRGDEPITFERAAGRWMQVEPFAHPMDSFSIQQLIKQALAIELKAEDMPDLPPAASLGLDPPLARITYAWGDDSLTLELGRRGLAGRAYLRRAGDDRIYIVDQSLHQRAIEMDVKEWRDRSLFRFAGVESDEIELVAGETTIVLARDRRRWLMTTPVRTRLNEAVFDELLQVLGRAKSAGFILDEPEDLSRFGLQSPVATARITTTVTTERRGEVVREPVVEMLRIGARIGVGTQDRYGMLEDRPVVVRITEPVLKALFRQPVSLISPIASGVGASDVKSIRIATPQGEFELRRDVDRWIAPGHDGRLVPREPVDVLLDTLTRAAATEIRIAQYPRDLEVAIVTFLGYGDKPLDTVRIIRDTTEDGQPGTWGLENGDSVLRIFPATTQIPLRPRLYDLPGW